MGRSGHAAKEGFDAKAAADRPPTSARLLSMCLAPDEWVTITQLLPCHEVCNRSKRGLQGSRPHYAEKRTSGQAFSTSVLCQNQFRNGFKRAVSVLLVAMSMASYRQISFRSSVAQFGMYGTVQLSGRHSRPGFGKDMS